MCRVSFWVAVCLRHPGAGSIWRECRMDKQAGPRDRFERLSSKLAQLEAMLTMISGEGMSHFHQQQAELQGYFLGMCSRLAGECRDLCESLQLAELDGEVEAGPQRSPMLLN
jgi:hypothetical protein